MDEPFDEAVKEASRLDGALGAAIVDYRSGEALSRLETGIDMKVAGSGAADVIEGIVTTLSARGSEELPGEIMVTLGAQYHLIYPLPDESQGLRFLIVVLDRAGGGAIQLARRRLTALVKSIS